MPMAIEGKALVVITRLGDSHGSKHWDITPFIQTCSGPYWHFDVAYEEFQLMNWGHQSMPSRARKMGVGETIRVALNFQIILPNSDYSDDGCELFLTKVRTRRHQYPKDVYRVKH